MTKINDMRQIKFRVWDGEKMRNVTRLINLDAGPDTRAVCSDGTVIKLWKEEGEEIKPNAVLMQYTGRMDKEKREIYEGDIIERDGGWGVVGWRFSDVYAGFTAGGDVDWGNAMSSVVIGNKYENPELIESP